MSVYGTGGNEGRGSGDYGGAMPAGGAYVPGGAYAPAPLQPKVRFEIIGEAWGLFQQQMGTWVLATLILFVINFSLSLLLAMVGRVAGLNTSGRSGEPNLNVSSVTFSLVSNLITTSISYFFMGGLYRMALKQLRGQAISAGDIFTAGDIFVPLFLTMLLYGLSVFGGTLFCIVPGFLIAGMLMLASTIIVDKRETSPVQALKASWNALKPEMLNAVLFMFVLGIVASAGVLGCGVGILFTYPLLFLGHALLYRDFFGAGTAAETSLQPGVSGPQNPWASGPLGDKPSLTPPPPSSLDR